MKSDTLISKLGILFLFFLPFFLYFNSSTEVINYDNEINDLSLQNGEDKYIWEEFWGGTGSERGLSIWGDNTNLYTIGYTNSIGIGGYDLCLLKWDNEGNLIWSKTWGGSDADYGYSIDGEGTNLFTIGYTNSFGAGSTDVFLVRWNSTGSQLWNRTWGGSGGESGYSLWLNESSLYATGYTSSFGAGSHDLFLIKLDIDGNQIWNRTWGGTDEEEGNSVWGEGDYLYSTGYTGPYLGTKDLCLIKWAANGTQMWNRTWGGSDTEKAYSLWGEGDYIYTTGYTKSFGLGNQEIFLIKWDSNGTQIWNRTWGDIYSDLGYSIWGDGDYVYITGYSGQESGLLHLCIIKYDTNGNLIRDSLWAGAKDNVGYSIWGYGEYIYTTGRIDNFDTKQDDLCLIKWSKELPEGDSENSETPTIYGYSIAIYMLLSIVLISVFIFKNGKKLDSHN